MISVGINTHNDNEECAATIKSIRQTTSEEVDIVVIDDGSPVPFVTSDPRVRIFRMAQRIGSGPSRHMAAIRAKFKWVLLVDSHTRFAPGWEEECHRLSGSSRPDVIWNGRCMGLSPENMDMSKAAGHYDGARAHFVGKDAQGAAQVLEGKWIPARDGDLFQVGCIMGANYFVNRDWFHSIGGMGLLHSWGSEELFVSLKAWLVGGECRVSKRLLTGHQFRKRAAHTNKTPALIYNKFVIARVCLPDAAADAIGLAMPDQYPHAPDILGAQTLLQERTPQIELERARIASMTTRTIEEYLEQFSVPRFW